MAEQEGSKFDIGKIIALSFIVLNVLVLGAGTYLVYAATLGHERKIASEAQLDAELDEFRDKLRGKPVVYSMEHLNTNLTGIPRRMIRLQVNLEMLDEEGFEEVIQNNSEARDAIVRIVNGKTFDDVESVQGKLHLKNEITTALNGILDRGVVKNIYFSDFAVQ